MEMELKKVKVEEEKINLDFLVLEQCVSFMKQKKFSDDLSLESVNKQFASLLRSNHRNLKVSFEIHNKYDEYCDLNLAHQHWEDDLIMEHVCACMLNSICKKVFIRFKRFRCIRFKAFEYSNSNFILSQVCLSENQYFPIEVKQLKLVVVDMDLDISSLINTFLRSLVFTGENVYYKTALLTDCVKLLKHLKHFQFSGYSNDDGKGTINLEWLIAAFQDNIKLHSLSLFGHDEFGEFDLAQLCAPSLRSIMSR